MTYIVLFLFNNFVYTAKMGHIGKIQCHEQMAFLFQVMSGILRIVVIKGTFC